MKKHLLSVTLFFVSLIVSAGEVTEQEALQKAQQFLKGRTFQQKNLRRASTANTFAQDAFYVFNADGNQGFVIVSADDRTESILGYADAGSLDLNNLPDNAVWWLQGYARQIKNLGTGAGQRAARRVPGTEKVLLETARYSQNDPYNGMLPSDKNGQVVTGCVATAMAIVMQYNQWPKSVEGIKGYTSTKNNYSIEMPDLPATTFDYDHLKMTYRSGSTYTEADSAEVAKLMLYCGQAVGMAYSSRVSSGKVHVSTMVNTFGYSPAARELKRYGFTDDEWQKLIYDEIVARRVVLYGGFNESSGHEFVIDGYDGNGLFHVNWGWNGSCDGYFSLATLNADGPGVSGYNVDNGYSMGQDAIIGLKPKADGDVAAAPIVYAYCDMDKYGVTEFTRDSESEDFQDISLRTYFTYTGLEEKTIYYKVEAWKDGTCADLVVGNNSVGLKEGKYWGRSNTGCYFGANLADGTYELRIFYRFEDTEEWKEPLQARNSSKVYATIEGNNMTLSSTSVHPYVINEVKYEGDCVVHRPMEVTIDWTRPANNESNVNNFYLWIEGDDDYQDERVGGVTSYIAQGQSEKLTITFKPNRAGELSFFLTSDGAGSDMIAYELFTINVRDMDPQKLILTWDDKNVKTVSDDEYTLYGTEFNPEIRVQNQGSNDYVDDIILIFTAVDGNNEPVGEKISTYKKVDVKAGEETTFNAQYTGLVVGQRYQFRGYHYTNENKGDTYFRYKFRANITVSDPTGINAVKAVEVHDGPVYNLQGQRVDATTKGLVIRNGKKYVVK